MKLIPFNLEAALAGADVRTRDGRKVGKLEKSGCKDFPWSANCGGCWMTFTNQGIWSPWKEESKNDLFLVAPDAKPRETIWTSGTRWPENKFAGKEGL